MNTALIIKILELIMGISALASMFWIGFNWKFLIVGLLFLSIGVYGVIDIFSFEGDREK